MLQGKMIKKIKNFNITYISLSLILTLFLYIFFGLMISNNITKDDIDQIKKLNLFDKCSDITNFQSEMTCIDSVQNKVFNLSLKFNTNCNKGLSAEPKDFVERRSGCCVEYTRFIEKILNYYEFQTRHIFLIQPYKGFSILNLFPLSQQSHASSEVYTSKGWLVIDAKYPIKYKDIKNENSKVFSFLDILNNRNTKKEFMDIDFFEQEVDIIYGLYSRHGYFYGPELPGPEFNLKELIYNFKNFNKK